jgi:hypothetical protein
MNDAQVQAMFEQWSEKWRRQLEDLKLRQWCVEQVVKHLENNHVQTSAEFIAIADEILKFISAPFAEVFKDKN